MRRVAAVLAGIAFLALPGLASAQQSALDSSIALAPESGGGSLAVFLFGLAVIITIFLVRVWTGILNVSSVYNTESLALVEREHPYLPEPSIIVGTILVTAALVVLSADTFGEALPLNALFKNSTLLHRIITIVLAIAAFGVFDSSRFHKRTKRNPYLFAFVIGTIATWVLIGFSFAFFSPDIRQDPFLMALGITVTVAGWRFLFGPWEPRIKATVLGTFIFWVSYTMLQGSTREELSATGLASIVAVIPAVLWCKFFLSYHKQKLSTVILAFFAGILSVAPILFYDALARRAIEFDFFLFRIVPQHFGSSAETFVQESVLSGFTGVSSAVLVTLVTFIIVAVIEEASKFWVLKRSSQSFFASIDDAVQMAIVVAIGFAFAENIVNPNYFVGFVRDYLIRPASPDWGQFLGNVFGRAVLTNMVHILSTGVLGYYFAVAYFATPVMRRQAEEGKRHPLLQWLHSFLSLNPKDVFKREKIVLGLLAAIVLHGAFNFIVSIPSVLPGNPATLGALLGSSDDSFLHAVSIVLVPALLYVVGGTWLLSYLLMRKEDLKEFGRKVESETFVTIEPST